MLNAQLTYGAVTRSYSITALSACTSWINTRLYVAANIGRLIARLAIGLSPTPTMKARIRQVLYKHKYTQR